MLRGVSVLVLTAVMAQAASAQQPSPTDLSADPAMIDFATHGLAGDASGEDTLDPFDDTELVEDELMAEAELYEPAGEVAAPGPFHDPDAVLPPPISEIPEGSLADMQADLRAVAADLQALRAQLLASGAEGFAAAGGDSALDRMDAIEAQISTLTDRTEQLENRLRRVVSDGTRRLGDIEFRLCELDAHCDLAALMTAELGAQGGPMQGGMQGPSAPILPGDSPDIISTPLPPVSAPQAAPASADEQRQFAAAQQAVEEGDTRAALGILDRLILAHSGGPLTAQAMLLRGQVLHDQGANEEAAASWLEAFAANPDGPTAPPALLSLAGVVATIGAPQDACPYLAEIVTRFPATPEAARATTALQETACPDEAGDLGD